MNKGDCSYMVDSATVFFDYVRIAGWFHSRTDELVEIELAGKELNGISGAAGLPHPGVVKDLGENKGFLIQAILEARQRTKDLTVIFRTRNGKVLRANLLALCIERKEEFKGRALLRNFLDIVDDAPGAKLLDIGGRARSGVERRGMFEHAQCTVIDILPGDGVDVVGDAHAMSALLAPNSFDAIFSVSVFEHLLMPWVVAREMGKVLRLGGYAYISTHQTIGVHDQPWDFWRFSDTAWDAIFNRYSGFEIIGRSIDNPQYITPHFWSPEQGDDLECAAGYLGSNVLVRKISEPDMAAGPVDVASLVDTAYPDTVEKLPVWFKEPGKKFRWNI